MFLLVAGDNTGKKHGQNINNDPQNYVHKTTD